MHRKRGKLIFDVLFYLVLIAAVISALLFSQGKIGNQSIGGYHFFEVLTSSMESVYPKGSLVFVKKVPISELVVDDDITFVKDTGLIITHRIVEIEEDYNNTGQRAFVTKGVNNAAVDRDIVLDDNVIGKVTNSIPGIGNVISWIGENLQIIVTVFLSLTVAFFCIKRLLIEFRQNDDIPKKE